MLCPHLRHCCCCYALSYLPRFPPQLIYIFYCSMCFYKLIPNSLFNPARFAGKRAQTLTNATAQQQLQQQHQQQQQLVPPVEILPSQSAQQSTELSIAASAPLVIAPPAAATAPAPATATAPAPVVATTPSLVSPVESPRRSIILQPPMADALQQAPSFIFAQVSSMCNFQIHKNLITSFNCSPLLYPPSRRRTTATATTLHCPI